MLKVNLEAQEHYSYGSIDKYAVNMDVFEALDANQKTIEIYEMNGASYDDTIHLYSLETTLLLKEAEEADDDDDSSSDKEPGALSRIWAAIKRFFTWLWRTITFQSKSIEDDIDKDLKDLDNKDTPNNYKSGRGIIGARNKRHNLSPDMQSRMRTTFKNNKATVSKVSIKYHKTIKVALTVIDSELKTSADGEKGASKRAALTSLKTQITEARTKYGLFVKALKIMSNHYRDGAYDNALEIAQHKIDSDKYNNSKSKYKGKAPTNDLSNRTNKDGTALDSNVSKAKSIVKQADLAEKDEKAIDESLKVATDAIDTIMASDNYKIIAAKVDAAVKKR